jgi:hypothetical protein
MRYVYVYAAEDAMQLILQGAANRRVGETKMNEQSSRSHSVFTMKVECRSSTDSGLVHTQYGTLHMVDLAGSERVKISGADGSALTEASEINKSLTVLSRVISKVLYRPKMHMLSINVFQVKNHWAQCCGCHSFISWPCDACTALVIQVMKWFVGSNTFMQPFSWKIERLIVTKSTENNWML